MRAMALYDLLLETNPAQIPDIINKYSFVKRVLTSGTNLQSKTVCVDGRVLYIGSDNAYPEYNEQHGCWLEDESDVNA